MPFGITSPVVVILPKVIDVSVLTVSSFTFIASSNSNSITDCALPIELI